MGGCLDSLDQQTNFEFLIVNTQNDVVTRVARLTIQLNTSFNMNQSSLGVETAIQTIAALESEIF